MFQTRSKVDALELRVQFLEKLLDRAEARLNALETRKTPEPSSVPLHFSEEEEDLRYALNTGQIDRDTFDSLLGSTGFANTEIEFAAEDYPRLSLIKPS